MFEDSGAVLVPLEETVSPVGKERMRSHYQVDPNGNLVLGMLQILRNLSVSSKSELFLMMTNKFGQILRRS
jgi:hypothetical protein